MIKFICDKCEKESTKDFLTQIDYIVPSTGETKSAGLCTDCYRKVKMAINNLKFDFIRSKES